jgi:methyltransferase (TIGR00027 family)
MASYGWAMFDGAGGPSRTAMMTAAARALHRDEPPPWVLDDALAIELAGEEGVEIRDRLRAELSPQSLLAFSRWVCVRARVPEDVVERELAQGVDQYVILGAGLDTFASRRGDLASRVRVFEVDHPDTQRWKRSRLQELGVDPEVVYVPVDFERQTLRAGLEDAGFDFGSRAVFSWIGVIMYLTLEAIEATLMTIHAAAPGSRVVLTYDLPSDALSGLGTETQGVLARIVADLGEPMVRRFRPAEIEALLRRLGFTSVEHVGPEEAKATYFPGRDDVAFGGAQRIATATVA